MKHFAAVLGCGLAETLGIGVGRVVQRVRDSWCYQEAIATGEGNCVRNSLHGQPAIRES
jgi:hypothetical protein